MATKRKPHSSSFDPTELHVQQVYKDKSFQKAVIKIKDNYAELFIGKTDPLKDFGPEPFLVYDDKTKKPRQYMEPNYLEDKNADEAIRTQIYDLAVDYAVGPIHIIMCINFPDRLYKPVRNSRAPIGDDGETLFVRILPNTALDDIINSWPFIDDMKKHFYITVNSKTGKLGALKPTKNKPNEDPELVYAIFRARRRGLTFPQIFLQYQKGELELYKDKPTNNFSSDKSLEAYYNRLKPIA
jgi:hypothetical protein